MRWAATDERMHSDDVVRVVSEFASIRLTAALTDDVGGTADGHANVISKPVACRRASTGRSDLVGLLVVDPATALSSSLLRATIR
ncbi:MAG: hypothetical protein ABIW84_05720 [Ilumatobacteraceae bacterium]